MLRLGVQALGGTNGTKEYYGWYTDYLLFNMETGFTAFWCSLLWSSSCSDIGCSSILYCSAPASSHLTNKTKATTGLHSAIQTSPNPILAWTERYSDMCHSLLSSTISLTASCSVSRNLPMEREGKVRKI